MTRIVAGNLKGRVLKTPPGSTTRPTSSKVREAIFSKLSAWGAIEGAAALDLFAGSGALGIEAVSRGAQSCCFVEQSNKALPVLKANVQIIGNQGQVVRGDAARFVTTGTQTYDLVFADPPYDWSTGNAESMLKELSSRLTPMGLIVFERRSTSAPLVPPAGLVLEDQRTWGETTVYFIGVGAPEEEEGH